jgi:putative resolvase
MKLSHWAKKNGITYQTAWNLFKKGMIPNASQLQSGTILVSDSPPEIQKDEYVVCYARVSSSQNKNNLDSQSDRLTAYCNARGYIVTEIVKECASGLNDKRPKLTTILKKKEVTKIVCEHQGRLTRFGFNYLKILLERQGCEIEIINPASDDKDDLMQDFVSIVTSFYSRLYGLRRSRRNTEKLIKELND